MDRTTVFSKTGKGLLEIKSKASRLPKDQVKVLTLVDGKATLEDLVGKSRIVEVELRKILNALASTGFIKEFTSAASSSPSASPTTVPGGGEAEDLDFTQVLGPVQSGQAGRVTESSARTAATRSDQAEGS